MGVQKRKANYLCVMKIDQAAEEFLAHTARAFEQQALQGLTFSKPTKKAPGLLQVYVRPVMLGKGLVMSCTYRYETRDETKNYPLGEALELFRGWLGEQFLNADLRAAGRSWSIRYSRKRKPKLISGAAAATGPAIQSHNQEKKRLIKTAGNIYLQAMGITTATGELSAAGQRKYRQIDKYIEIVDSLIRQHPLPRRPVIVDMGSGKGYLSFALYDHLKNNLGLEPVFTGLEIRPHLVAFGNALAKQCGFEGLSFEARDIRTYAGTSLDMLIALHACDTLTDIALAAGVRAEAGIIVVAPCCHKQVRQAMQPPADLASLLRFGILEERQAELLTDGIRALLLSYVGYQTKVFEFVSLEHTGKNLMITGLRGRGNPEALAEVEKIKQLFGVKDHFLEQLLIS